MPFIIHGTSVLLGFVLALAVALVTLASWDVFQDRRRRLESASHGSRPDLPGNIKRVFRGRLPFWIKNPEALGSSVEFLNTALRLLWPRIDRAASEWAFKDSALEDLLNSQTFWKPAWMRASGIVLQTIMLGERPAHVEGITVYDTHSNRNGSPAQGVVMDIAFAWSSNMVVKISMKHLDDVDSMSVVDRLLACVYKSMTVSAVVRDLVVRGTARVTLSPLLDRAPVVGACHICFLEPPAMSYDVTSMGARPLLIPGLELAVRSFVEDVALDPFTFPDGVVIDVAKLIGMDSVSDAEILAVGVLCVTIQSASGLPKTDLFGSIDPYVTLFLESSKKASTQTKANTVAPQWDEEFDFLVHDEEHQQLHLMLYDAEMIGVDELVGTANVRLGDLEWTNRTAEIEVDIDVVVGEKRQRNKRRNKRQAPRSLTSAGSQAVRQSRFVYTRDLHREKESQLDQLKDDIFRKFAGAARPPPTLRLKLEYLPFLRRASQGDQASKPRLDIDESDSNPNLSTRAQRFLDGGMLHIRVGRAYNLRMSAQLTKKYSIIVRVRRGDGSISDEKLSEKSGGLNSINPSFEIVADILLGSETARSAGASIEVEIVSRHHLRNSSSRGVAIVALSSVISSGRLASRTYPLRDADTGELARGELELELSWASTL